MKIILAFTLIIILSACVEYKYNLPKDSKVDLPLSFSTYKNLKFSQREVNSNEIFKNEELATLLKRTITNSPTLKISFSKVKQFMALEQISKANKYPTLNFSGDFTHSHQEIGYFDASSYSSLSSTGGSSSTSSLASPTSTYTTTVNNYSSGLFASYELDLWGRLEAGRNSANLNYKASIEDYRSAIISINALLTETWLAIIEQSKLKKITEKILSLSDKKLELIKFRRRRNLTSNIQVNQQEQELETIKARILLIGEGKKQLENKLYVLLGEVPNKEQHIKTVKFPELPEIPIKALSSEELINRPDVKAIFLRIDAGKWDINVAKLSKLPAFNLSASLFFSAPKIEKLFDNWISYLSSSIAGPIFDGKRRDAELNQRKAILETLLYTYKDSILNALGEVEDALLLESKSKEYIILMKKKIKLSENIFKDTQVRYMNGTENFLKVISLEQSLYENKINLISAKRKLLSARVALFRALGGYVKGRIR